MAANDQTVSEPQWAVLTAIAVQIAAELLAYGLQVLREQDRAPDREELAQRARQAARELRETRNPQDLFQELAQEDLAQKDIAR